MYYCPFDSTNSISVWAVFYWSLYNSTTVTEQDLKLVENEPNSKNLGWFPSRVTVIVLYVKSVGFTICAFYRLSTMNLRDSTELNLTELVESIAVKPG